MAWVDRIINKNNTGVALDDRIVNKNNDRIINKNNDRIVNKNNTSVALDDRIVNKNNDKNNTSVVDCWTWPPVELGKLNCILCQKVITFFHGSTNEFFQHIEIEHKIFINHGLLLSIIFLDNETLDEIRDMFVKNLNALKVSGSAVLEETIVGNGKDAYIYEDGRFGDNGDGFDEDKMFDDFANVFDQNEKESSFMRKEDFCKKQIEGNGVLENVPKYKPGPKSYKIKQLLKNKQERILSNSDNEILRESEKHANYKVKDTKNKFSILNENLKGQVTLEDRHKNLQPLKNILEKEIEDDVNMSVNSLSDNFVDTDWSKLNDLYTSGSKRKSCDSEFVESYKVKRQNIWEPNPNSATSMIDEIKHMLKSYTFDSNVGSNIEMHGESKDKYNQPLDTETTTLSVETSERLVKSSVEDQIKSLFECEEFDENNSVKSSENQIVEENIKNVLYFDNLDKDKNTKSKTFKSSVKSPKKRKASVKDRLSSKYESDVPNSPNLEDINSKMPNLKYTGFSLNPEEIDSKHANPQQSQNSGIKYPINVDTSEYFQKRPNQLSGYNLSESVKNQFVFDESLPDGWKIRRIWRETKNNYDTDYLSPDGRKARSKVAVLEYMKLLGIYSPEDYDKIIPNYELNLYKVFT